MITVVVSVTDEEIYAKRLGHWLSKQPQGSYKGPIKTPPELTLAESYNTVEVETAYLLFLHQDIIFLEKNFFPRLEQMCNSLKDLGLGGFAGKKGRLRIGRVLRKGKRQDVEIEYEGEKIKLESLGKKIEIPTKVDLIDDIGLVVPKETWKKIKFDEQRFPFHLIGADYSMSVKKTLKKNNYILPFQIWTWPTRDTPGWKEENTWEKAGKRFKKKWGVGYV